MVNPRWRLTRWLERAPAGTLDIYAVVTAFTAYFCIYAFRKPFTAAPFDGQFAGTQIQLKTAFVVSQIIGYGLAKYIGIKIISESSRSQRAWMLVGLVAMAQGALVLFAILPMEYKVGAMLLNGLPLGMIWGLVVRYLEGRQTSDILLAGLACSFIVASGVFKDVGRAMLAGDPIPMFGIGLPNPLPPLDEMWMPSATGFLFFPALFLAVWLLDQVPEPTQADIAARTERTPMDKERRREFLLLYLPGIVPLVVAYVFLTAFREYRDFYQVDVLKQLGYLSAGSASVLTRMELGIGIGVLITMSLLYLVQDNRRALLTVLGVIAVGFAMMGAATLLHLTGAISGYAWLALIGLGGYMAYVPYNSVLFDRLMASTGFVGTAVFAIYVADSAGYTCSVSIQLGKDMLAAHLSRMQFLEYLSLFVSATGAASILIAGIYFWRQGRRPNAGASS